MSVTEEIVKVIPRNISVIRQGSDKVFRGILIAGGLAAFVLLSGIFGYLAISAAPVLKAFGLEFFTGSSWYAGDGLLPSEGSMDPPTFGLAPMLWGSLLIAIIAVVIAIPMAIGIALAATYFLPKKIAFAFTIFVDLVAAIPSIVFGLWGFFVLMPHGALWAKWLNTHLGFIPFFKVEFEGFEQSPFMAGIVLAIMITPIIAAVSREIFSSVPPELITGAQALGASRWTMIRNVVLPFSKSGITGGAMLGLGRALGETIAVFFVLQLFFDDINWVRILESTGGSVASLIVSRFGEAQPLEISALFGAGLALFLITLATNALATTIVSTTNRTKK
ncbi:MAG: phosphate transport system permease protein [Actinomycetota bacterium]|jgi:phosphate transport system permease protein